VLSIEYTRSLYMLRFYYEPIYAASGCLKALDVFKDLFQHSLRVSIVYRSKKPPAYPANPNGPPIYVATVCYIMNEFAGKKFRHCDSTRAYTTQAVACERDNKLDCMERAI
jgi:hypothetical protein